jgi:hypothetical protein
MQAHDEESRDLDRHGRRACEETVESCLGQPKELAVASGPHGGRAGSTGEDRHFTHALAARDLADTVLRGPVGNERSKASVKEHIQTVVHVALSYERLPTRKVDQLDVTFEFTEDGIRQPPEQRGLSQRCYDVSVRSPHLALPDDAAQP